MSVRFCPPCAAPLAPVDMGAVSRSSCPDAVCGCPHWDNAIPVAGSIVEHEGKVVLAARPRFASKHSPGGRCRCRSMLAKRAGFVLESNLESSEMNRTYAFWFYFYGFPQPLAEGLN